MLKFALVDVAFLSKGTEKKRRPESPQLSKHGYLDLCVSPFPAPRTTSTYLMQIFLLEKSHLASFVTHFV